MLKMKLLLIFVLLSLTIGGAASVQGFEAVDLVIWARDGSSAELLSSWFDTWAEVNAPGSTLSVVPHSADNLNNDLLTANPSDLPDIVVDGGEALASYANAGLITPLDGYVNTSAYEFGTASAGQVYGSTYGIPLYSGGHTMMIINTALVTSTPQTFDEVFALAAQFSGTDVNGLLLPIEDARYLLPFAFGFGGSVMDSSGNFTLNDSAWVSAYTFMQTLATIVPSGCDEDCVDNQFMDGGAAMVISDDLSLSLYIEDGVSSMAVIPFPALPNGQRPRTFINAEYASITVNASGPKLEAALAFLNWVSTDANVALNAASDYGRLPADTALLSNSTVTSNPLLTASLDVYRNGVLLPANNHVTCMWAALDDALNGVLNGALTPEAAAAQAQQDASQCAANIG